jgi:hypothetical protein
VPSDELPEVLRDGIFLSPSVAVLGPRLEDLSGAEHDNMRGRAVPLDVLGNFLSNNAGN